MPVNGLQFTHHCKLFPILVLLQLIANILCNLRRILPRRIDIIASAPEFAIAVLKFQFGELFVKHQTTLSLQEAHEARNTHLGKNLQKHVDMIRADFRLQNIEVLPFAKGSEDFPDFSLLFSEKDLPTELGSKDNMIFTVPARMSQCVEISIIFHSSLLVVL